MSDVDRLVILVLAASIVLGFVGEWIGARARRDHTAALREATAQSERSQASSEQQIRDLKVINAEVRDRDRRAGS